MGVYDDAVQVLEWNKRPNFEEASQALTLLGSMAAVCGAYRELFAEEAPEKIANLKRHLPTTLRGLCVVDEPAERVLEAVGELFPVTETWLEDADFGFLEIEEQNFRMNWDQFAEFVEKPEEYASAGAGFAFVMMIWCRGNTIDRATWGRLSNALGWNAEYPARIMNGKMFDWARLVENLKDAGLACFEAAINMAWKSTGNYFLDFDREEAYECGDMPTWSTENIVMLAKEWQAAAPILEAWQEACTMLEYDESLYGQILDIMAASLSEREAVMGDDDD